MAKRVFGAPDEKAANQAADRMLSEVCASVRTITDIAYQYRGIMY